MFKKSLVALALASVSAGALAAADINTNTETRNVSVQGAASLTNANAGAIVIDLGAEYAVGDILTLTFTGGDLVSGAPATLNVVLPDADDTMVLGLLNSTATELTYRVTELSYDSDATDTTNGATITIPADTLAFEAADILAAGTVSVAYAARTATNFDLDTPASGDGSADLFTTQDQFGGSVTTTLDAVIDVETNRLTFESSATADVFAITPEDDAGDVLFDATVDEVQVVINGNFAVLDSDADTDGVQPFAGAVTVAGGTLDSVAADAITVTSGTVGAITVTIDVDDGTGDAASALSEQTFTADLSIDYSTHGTDADPTAGGTGTETGTANILAGAAAGAWTLNGSVVEVPYVPFGPVTQPILRHTNTGAQTGDITLRYMVEGEHTMWQDAGVIVSGATPGVRNILSQVTSALATAGYDATVSGFKVALEITTNVPGEDVTVFAGARINSSDTDRLTIGAFSN